MEKPTAESVTVGVKILIFMGKVTGTDTSKQVAGIAAANKKFGNRRAPTRMDKAARVLQAVSAEAFAKDVMKVVNKSSETKRKVDILTTLSPDDTGVAVGIAGPTRGDNFDQRQGSKIEDVLYAFTASITGTVTTAGLQPSHVRCMLFQFPQTSTLSTGDVSMFLWKNTNIIRSPLLWRQKIPKGTKLLFDKLVGPLYPLTTIVGVQSAVFATDGGGTGGSGSDQHYGFIKGAVKLPMPIVFTDDGDTVTSGIPKWFFVSDQQGSLVPSIKLDGCLWYKDM